MTDSVINNGRPSSVAVDCYAPAAKS